MPQHVKSYKINLRSSNTIILGLMVCFRYEPVSSSLQKMRWHLGLLPSLILQVGLLQTCAVATTASVHDDQWQPEYLLRATSEVVTMNCEQRESVIFNGTTPGPPLYLKEGKTTWVRVYNDMSDLNFTVVC